jgi:hypothetical protein
VNPEALLDLNSHRNGPVVARPGVLVVPCSNQISNLMLNETGPRVDPQRLRSVSQRLREQYVVK